MGVDNHTRHGWTTVVGVDNHTLHVLDNRGQVVWWGTIAVVGRIYLGAQVQCRVENTTRGSAATNEGTQAA